MKLDAPHGLHDLPPAPELRRTQDTATTSLKEHIYLYGLGNPKSRDCICAAFKSEPKDVLESYLIKTSYS
jgi:hypothetical protein